jgi:orotate phosphoribosyltransferase
MNDVRRRRAAIRRTVRRVPSDTQIIVGLASAAALPMACWVAHRLDLPLAYVRPGQAKGYGRQRQTEGAATEGQRVCFIADQDISEIAPLLRASRVDLVRIKHKAQS